MSKHAMILALILLASLASSAQTPHPTPDSGPASFGGGTYVYDPAGNIIGIDNQTFLYDTTGRLTSATVMAPDRSMVTQTYTYDVYGNLLSMNRPGVTQTMTVDVTTNQLTNNDASYNAAGNLIQWTAPGTTTTYKYDWDPLGNLQGIRLATSPSTDPPAVAYIYTAADERLWTFDPINDDSHFTIRDLGGQVLTDFHLNNGTWTWTRDYFYRDGVMLASAWPNVVQHYTVDHLGTPRLITDDQGNQIAAQTFLPFGEELQQTFANGASIKKFTGHERDADPGLTGTSLDYMHARFYTASMGRFLSADPHFHIRKATITPGLWNRYTYAANSPLVAIDPDGRDVVAQGDVVDQLRIKFAIAHGFTGAEFKAVSLDPSTGKFRIAPGFSEKNKSKEFKDFERAVNNHTQTIDVHVAEIFTWYRNGPFRRSEPDMTRDHGGGATLDPNQSVSHHIEIWLNPNGGTENPQRDPFDIVAQHEFYGHAVPVMFGEEGVDPEGDARRREVQIREREGLPPCGDACPH